MRNAPAARDGSGPGIHTLHWTEGLATRAGYPTCVIVDHVRSLFRFLEGEEVAFRPKISAPSRARTLRVTMLIARDDDVVIDAVDLITTSR